MHQRPRDQHSAPLRNREVFLDGGEIRRDVSVGEHNALWPARGAAREYDESEIVVLPAVFCRQLSDRRGGGRIVIFADGHGHPAVREYFKDLHRLRELAFPFRADQPAAERKFTFFGGAHELCVGNACVRKSDGLPVFQHSSS